jgi:hypothetical protein
MLSGKNGGGDELKEKRQQHDEAEAHVVRALKIEGIDLEPTEDELDFFLTHESTIGVEEILRIAQQQPQSGSELGTDLEKAYQEMVAMNRKNAANSFTDQTKATIEKKRQKLLDELSRRHQNADE